MSCRAVGVDVKTANGLMAINNSQTSERLFVKSFQYHDLGVPLKLSDVFFEADSLGDE